MSHSFKVLALTGGIATGKSTLGRILVDLLPETVIFDADASVGTIYRSDEVKSELLDHFGERVLLADGEFDKSYLRSKAFSDDAERRFLEQVFHPRVMKECLALLAKTATKGASRLFVADIPLLFERGIDFGQSANVLVATSPSTQRCRLKNRNGWDDVAVSAVLKSQMPIQSKLALADVVFWNDGPETMLRSQVLRFISSLPPP